MWKYLQASVVDSFSLLIGIWIPWFLLFWIVMIALSWFGCLCFVAFSTCAEQALSMLNGTQIAGQNIRLSWGRSPSNKQVWLMPLKSSLFSHLRLYQCLFKRCIYWFRPGSARPKPVERWWILWISTRIWCIWICCCCCCRRRCRSPRP